MVLNGLLLFVVTVVIGSSSTIWLFEYFKRRQIRLSSADEVQVAAVPEGEFVVVRIPVAQKADYVEGAVRRAVEAYQMKQVGPAKETAGVK